MRIDNIRLVDYHRKDVGIKGCKRISIREEKKHGTAEVLSKRIYIPGVEMLHLIKSRIDINRDTKLVSDDIIRVLDGNNRAQSPLQPLHGPYTCSVRCWVGRILGRFPPSIVIFGVFPDKYTLVGKSE